MFSIPLYMKKILLFLISILGITLVACNDEVFLRHPEPTEPESPEPEPPDEPEFTDSLRLISLTYDPTTLEEGHELWTTESKTTFFNHDSEGDMTVLFDNYNHSIIRVFNSTYYAVPWAKSEPIIEIPSFNSELVPGFYGVEMPFAFGSSTVKSQFLAGHQESIHLPADTKVTAIVFTTRKMVMAKADIEYTRIEEPYYKASGWVNVVVWQPVDMRLEWGEITPIETEEK